MTALDNVIMAHPDVVSYWPLDEAGPYVNGNTVTDVVGGINGIVGPGAQFTQGATSFIPAGTKCVRSISAGTGIRLGNFHAFSGTAPFSILMWYYKDDLAGTDGASRVLFDARYTDGTGNNGWVMQTNSGRVQIIRQVASGNGNTVIVPLASAIVTPVRALFAATYNGTTRTIYQVREDTGILESASASDTRSIPSASPVLSRIGLSISNGSTVQAALDAVAIFDSAVTAAFIEHVWDAGWDDGPSITLPTSMSLNESSSGLVIPSLAATMAINDPSPSLDLDDSTSTMELL